MAAPTRRFNVLSAHNEFIMEEAGADELNKSCTSNANAFLLNAKAKLLAFLSEASIHLDSV